MACLRTSDFGIGNNDVNGIPTSDIGIDNIVDTTFFEIRGDVNTSAATVDYEPRVEMHENVTQEEKRQAEIRHQQVTEGVRREAVTALLQQEQKHTQQQAHDQAQAAARIQQIEHQAQGFIYTKHKVLCIEKGKRERERERG